MMLRPLVLALAAVLALPLAAQAANYTYRGELMDGDAPAEGAYDLRIRTFAQAGASKALGEPTELPGVKLSAGRFSVELDVPEDADGTTWVEVAVRRAGSGDPFETLGDPQLISKTNSTCPGAWALDGNSGMPAGSFLGTADASALELRVNNRRVMHVEANGTDAPSIVGGSPANVASSMHKGQTIAGGGNEGTSGCGASGTGTCGNQTVADYSTIGGGFGNRALGESSVVAGGASSRALGHWSAVVGGRNNVASGNDSIVGGGVLNEAKRQNSVVGGGQLNVANGSFAVVSGGASNAANAYASSVGGGYGNCAGGDLSWSGGFQAIVRSGNGVDDVVCGTGNSGDFDGDEGTFVWADTSGEGFKSTGPNQFLIRANGGVGINTATFGNAVNLRGSEVMVRNNTFDGNTDVTLLNSTNRGYVLASVPPPSGTGAGEFFIGEADARTSTVIFANKFRIDAAGTTHTVGGVIGDMSDARLKKNFAPIARPLQTLLALNGTMFEYIDPAKAMSAPGPRMGFIAQEVQKVLPNWVHPSMDGYLSVGTIGFEALAVEAIRDLKIESDLRIEALERDNAALRQQLDALTQRFSRLESRQER